MPESGAAGSAGSCGLGAASWECIAASAPGAIARHGDEAAAGRRAPGADLDFAQDLAQRLVLLLDRELLDGFRRARQFDDGRLRARSIWRRQSDNGVFEGSDLSPQLLDLLVVLPLLRFHAGT